MPQIQVGEHSIDVSNSFWGAETVRYDGETQAKGYSFLGRSYMFNVKEEDEDVTYEVEFKAGLLGAHFTIRRNGRAIFTS